MTVIKGSRGVGVGMKPCTETQIQNYTKFLGNLKCTQQHYAVKQRLHLEPCTDPQALSVPQFFMHQCQGRQVSFLCESWLSHRPGGFKVNSLKITKGKDELI